MTKIIKSWYLSFALACAFSILSGCKGTLQPGGAYNPTTTNAVGVVSSVPDKPFLAVEAAFDLAYSALDAAFTTERNNRAMFWALSPDIKHTLDTIRPRAVIARNSYIKARDLYVSVRSSVAFDELKKALAHMQDISKSAQSVIPK